MAARPAVAPPSLLRFAHRPPTGGPQQSWVNVRECKLPLSITSRVINRWVCARTFRNLISERPCYSHYSGDLADTNRTCVCTCTLTFETILTGAHRGTRTETVLVLFAQFRTPIAMAPTCIQAHTNAPKHRARTHTRTRSHKTAGLLCVGACTSDDFLFVSPSCLLPL